MKKCTTKRHTWPEAGRLILVGDCFGPKEVARVYLQPLIDGLEPMAQNKEGDYFSLIGHYWDYSKIKQK